MRRGGVCKCTLNRFRARLAGVLHSSVYDFNFVLLKIDKALIHSK